MHDHSDHEHPHPHQPPPDDPEHPASYHQFMEIALRELLLEKGVVTTAGLRKQLETIDARSPAMGARLVARAWIDPAFKARLLQDGNAASEEMGIKIGEANLIVIENTAATHNVIVCTLCSCYPRDVLGLPPDWYKSKAYRSRMVREPRAVLVEFGTDVKAGVALEVHDSTAEKRYLVIPLRPAGTEHLTENELAALVTRDSMIGVACVEPPIA